MHVVRITNHLPKSFHIRITVFATFGSTLKHE